MIVDSLGNMKLSGTITSEASSFDMAEEYAVLDESIEAGDVVVASPSGFTPGGSKVDQAESNGKQSTNKVEKQESDIGITESHNLPLSADNTENTANPTVATAPNNNTNGLSLSSPTVNTGTTSVAKNTAEKLPQREDTALNPDLESFTTSSLPYIAKSSKPYQAQLLGIISTKPGIRLQTSSPSEARGYQTRPGAVVGKALEEFTGDNRDREG